MERVADVMLALGAHLTGDFVADAIARRSPEDVRLIEASVPASVVRQTTDVLQVASGVKVVVEGTACNACCGMTRLAVLVSGEHATSIEIRPHSGGIITLDGRGATIAFDRHILALSSDRLYKRCPTPVSVRALLGRARAKKFCLVPGFCRRECPLVKQQQVRPANHAHAMRSASNLISESGWVMDDAMAGRDAWVASSWEHVGLMRLTPGGLDPMAHDECPICQERFSRSDIVVNLPCNHNFHAVCHPASGGGLCAWLETEQASCPCCRVAVFTTNVNGRL